MTQRYTIYTNENALPEQRLVAAVIRQALLDANAGSKRARQWLRDDAPNWLVFITPSTADPAEIHARLIDRLDRSTLERQQNL